VGDRHAMKVIFLDKDNNDNHLKTLQTWTLIDNKAYIITYRAEEDKYAGGEKLAKKIINSLEIN